MKRALLLIALISASATATAAPRTPYGGSVAAFVLGPQLVLDPRALATASDLSIAAALYEPLYAIDAQGNLQPVLARALPELRARELIVPLRTDVLFHDGRPLTPAIAAASLAKLLEPASRAGHVLLPVKGALAIIGGDASAQLAIRVHPEEQSLGFELYAPYPEFARLLASPRAAIAATDFDRAVAPAAAELYGLRGPGTGAWTIKSADANEGLALAPFLGHRRGRPFLDALIVKSALSRFGTVSALRRGEAEIVFNVPDVRAVKKKELLAWNKSKLPGELVVLSIGRQLSELRSEDQQRAIDAALNRPTLAHRFLGGGAEPASTLFGEAGRDGRASTGGSGLPSRDPMAGHESAIDAGAPRSKLDATLLISHEDSALRRVAERVQLDLLRAGITVIIERVPPRTLEARRRDKRYDLMLDAFLPDAAPAGTAIDRFHALLSAAALAGAPSALLTREELTAFLEAPEAMRETMLPDLEKTVRLRAGVVPIAVRAPQIAVRSELVAYRLSPGGALIVDDAYIAGPSREGGE